jgi:two-component system, OmpR family, sensor kinase
VLPLARRLLPGGLRAQVTLAIALITALAIGLSLLAVYRGTGVRLRDRIDAELTTQVAEWDQLRASADLSTPAALTQMARQFLAAQRYHPAARIFIIDVTGRVPVTNQPDILAGEAERERQEGRPQSTGDGRGALPAPAGLATVEVAEAGRLRVLSDPISDHGRRVGTLQIADPLRSVQDAQDSLLRTFALVGSLAVILAILAGLTIATLIARPVRRMAGLAAAVDTGDLSLRAGEIGARGELGILAGAFDRMLARLERAFARQRDFVSDASHELRTPLAVLRAQVEVLDRETDDPHHHEATTTLLRRLDEMDRLITDMLTLAGAESGRLVEPRPIDLDDYFEDLRRDLPLFGDRDFHVEPIDGVLDADADRLTQVLRNLVRNAVVHTGPGDRITVAASTHDGHLELAIADTGPGIAPEHLDHIFERFYRAEGSRSRDSGGSGLGLAIARAIVEAHGGRIWAESEVGTGTTMHVELPGYRPPTR